MSDTSCNLRGVGNDGLIKLLFSYNEILNFRRGQKNEDKRFGI